MSRRLDQLTPEVSSAFGIAVGTFLLDPHGCRQDQIRRQRGDSWVGVGHHNEVGGISIARIGFTGAVGRCLKVIVDLDPVEIQLAVVEHAVLFDRMVSGLFRDYALRHPPDFLGMLAVLRIRHRHVRRQPVRKGADFARCAAGRGLPGE